MKQQIVILGAGYAGMMAAMRLSRTTRHRKDIQVTLVNAGADFVERIRLHQLAAGHAPKHHALRDLLRGTGIELVQGWVTAIDPAGQSLTVQTAAGEIQRRYDRLVYAPGSRTGKSSIPGAAQYAHTLDLPSAAHLREKLAAAPAGAVCLIVGGGLTSIEAATEFAETYPHLRVELVSGGTIGAGLSAGAQVYLHQVFGELGITVREYSRIVEITAGAALLADGTHLPYDLLLWTAGFEVPALARQSGIATNAAGQMLVDGAMRSISHPQIYAAGDAAAFAGEAGMPQMRLSCQVAMPMGAHVATQIAAELNGRAPQPFAFGYTLQCLSLGKKRGLAQMVRGDDTPTETIYTGRLGAWIKDGILRYTLWSIQAEKYIEFYQSPAAMRAQLAGSEASPMKGFSHG